MELREFAEQVLFSTDLKLKLQAPECITDDAPGAGILAPAAPGRPRELQFKPQGATREFPSVEQLEEVEHRGRLLHFFANHELLATELMALVLLRFPDAPAAFRKGVLQTLKDEQEHTRWYIDRMRAHGVEFGDMPVSGYFWRAISGMENPMDYVAGLSLTFEQANLDFARQFSGAFKQIGDADSAQLLEKIYRDEIAHVAYGLKWFRRWKNPTESDWDAFCRSLKFPLSPQRAKGGAQINLEGRRAAGLDEHFIKSLDVFAQSRGRTPTVFVFNPFAEGYVAQGKAFTPVKAQQQLARDLENLPQFLCRDDDVVIVERKPSVEFLSGIKNAGFSLPEFVERKDTARLAERKLGGLRPWAWAPDSAELLSPLFGSVTGESRPADERWNGGVAELYSKSWSAEFLAEVLRQKPFDCLCPTAVVGRTAETYQEALEAIAQFRTAGAHRLVVKQSIGLAGHNAIRLWEPEVMEAQLKWIERAIAAGRVIVEPWLDRQVDFSVQLEMTNQGLKTIGYTGLLNDAKGQYRGNWVEPEFARRLPAAVTSRFAESGRAGAELREFYSAVFATLEKKLRDRRYTGPIGIDAFVYRDASGGCRVKPVVEINPRYTMGRLAVELIKRAAPGTYGLLRLFANAELRREGWLDFKSFANALVGRAPLVFAGAPVARLVKGAVPLNDCERAEACLATWEVSPTKQCVLQSQSLTSL